MPSLEEFCRIEGSLGMNMIGKVPAGYRIDFPFEGKATSAHWEGERAVRGVDYATIRPDSNLTLDIRATIGEGKGQVSYRGSGVSIAGEKQGVAFPRELITFETADEDLAFLNDSIGVALGKGEGESLSLTVYLVKD